MLLSCWVQSLTPRMPFAVVRTLTVTAFRPFRCWVTRPSPQQSSGTLSAQKTKGNWETREIRGEGPGSASHCLGNGLLVRYYGYTQILGRVDPHVSGILAILGFPLQLRHLVAWPVKSKRKCIKIKTENRKIVMASLLEKILQALFYGSLINKRVSISTYCERLSLCYFNSLSCIRKSFPKLMEHLKCSFP